jgi:radical SAM superfamily enzyme YgiQ (UPF0313 family)
MKVLLVQAAQLDREGRPVVAKTSRFDDLTLASLAALAPRGVECLPVMEKLGEVDFEVDVGLVAITAMGVSPMLRAYQIADRFRARGVPVVLGGTNFSLNAAEAKQHADAVVLGDADRVFARVIEDAARRRLEPFYQGEPAGDLAGLPVPRYDLFSERPELRQALFTVQASRGCPHRCEYCAVGSLHEGRIRLRPVDEVIRDVQATGRRRIFFADDNLMAHPAYYKELFRRLTPLRIRWAGATTLSIARDPEMLRLARKSGCVILVIGIETLAQDNLNAANKTFNQVKEYGSLIKRVHDAGIVASCTTMFGFDGDDPGVFDRTVDFYLKNRVRVAPLFALTPVPGTMLWKRLKAEGRMLSDDYRRYDTMGAVFQPARMTPEQLESGLIHAHARLYSLGGTMRRLLPPLWNPAADLVAAAMNFQYARLVRNGEFGAFNFN